MMTVNINDMHTKYESLTKQQNVLEKELRVKTDKVSYIGKLFHQFRDFPNSPTSRYILDSQLGSDVKHNETKRGGSR